MSHLQGVQILFCDQYFQVEEVYKRYSMTDGSSLIPFLQYDI
jgi:hypothetical protein